MNDNSENTLSKWSGIKYDKNYISRGIAYFMRHMKVGKYYHVIRIFSSIMRVPAGVIFFNQELKNHVKDFLLERNHENFDRQCNDL